jgi:hypothetical protein
MAGGDYGFSIVASGIPIKQKDDPNRQSKKIGELPMPALTLNTPRLILATGAIAALLSFAEANAAEPAAQKDEALLSAPVTDQVLGESRGGSFTPQALNTSELDATNKDNIVIGGLTGNNTLGDNAINSQGLVNVIQNTGNNVIIQSATTISITFNK